MAGRALNAHTSESGATRSLAGYHALLVEDMPIMAKILGRTLDQMGISFDHVTDGRSALEAFECGGYDVIFMDIMMPGMDGVEATRRIRAFEAARARSDANGPVPIIAVTTRMSGPECARYHEAGMTDCVKKPVDRTTVEVMLEKYLLAAFDTEIDVEERYDVLSDEMEFVNWDTLNEYGALFKSGLAGLIEDYLIAAPSLLEMMGDAVQKRQAGHIHMFASQMKSASAVFGAEKLSHLSAQLEILAGKDKLDQVDTLFFDLHIAFEHTKNALSKKLVILRNL